MTLSLCHNLAHAETLNRSLPTLLGANGSRWSDIYTNGTDFALLACPDLDLPLVEADDSWQVHQPELTPSND